MSFGGGFQTFVKTGIVSATTGYSAYIAAEATLNIDTIVKSGLGSTRYRRTVNGVEDAPNSSLKLDGVSSIRAVFSNLAPAMAYVLSFVLKQSPRDSGKYAESWVFLIDNVPWTGTDPTTIPAGAVVSLLNTTDYNRKLDVGGMILKGGKQPHIIDRARIAVSKKFASIEAERQFLLIPGGYILQGPSHRSGISYNRKAKIWTRTVIPRRGRSDVGKGDRLTYPAVVMREI